MDVRQLRSFVTLAHHRHFTRAAAQPHIAQPALSQQIQQLERELGVLLVQRTRRRIELTAPGEVLLARAERILAEMERVQTDMAEFAGVRRGRIVLGVLQSLSGYWLSDVLTRFTRATLASRSSCRRMAPSNLWGCSPEGASTSPSCTSPGTALPLP